MENKNKFKGRTPEQIAWASKIVLKAICERIKKNQESGELTPADGYIASLLLNNKGV